MCLIILHRFQQFFNFLTYKWIKSWLLLMKPMLLSWQGSQVSGSKSWRVYNCYVSVPLRRHVWRLGSWNMPISCNSIFHNKREETFWSGNLYFFLYWCIFLIFSKFVKSCSFFGLYNNICISFLVAIKSICRLLALSTKKKFLLF